MTRALTFAILISLVIVVIGTLSSRRTSTRLDDYYLADRGVGRWFGAIAASAASESAWVMMGLVGAAYAGGVSVFWLVPGCVGGYAFNWFVLARKLQHGSRSTGAITVAELIGKETGSAVLRVVAALISVVFLTSYTAAQFFALGKALNTFGGMNIVLGTVLGAGFVLTYVTFGGMRASIYTDALQGLLMVLVLIVMPAYAWWHLAVVGTHTPISSLPAGFLSLTGDKVGLAFIGLVLGWAGIGLGYPGQPHVLQRHMSMKDPKDVLWGGAIALAWSTAVFIGAISSGIAARYLTSPSDPELSLLALAFTLTGPVLAGAAMAAIFAAIASTADSQLLVVSATIKNDVPWLRNSKLINPRVVTVVMAITAAVFASTRNTTIFDMVLYAWEFLGVTIGTAVIGAFAIRRGPKAILFSMAVGAATLIFWRNSRELSAVVYALVPAMGVAVTSLWVLGMFSRPKLKPALAQ